MRLLWVVPCVLALSCSKCDDRTTARDLLAMPGVSVKLSSLTVGEPETGILEFEWDQPPARCPKLDPDLKVLIDGKPAEAELGGARKNETIASLRCDRPRFTRFDLEKLEPGEERVFILEDRSARFEGRLRRVWESGVFALPGAYPGPGGHWFVAWSGPKPTEAVLGSDRLGIVPADGGFELVLPDPLTDPDSLLLHFPSWEVSKCSLGTCTPSGIDFWKFALDGGAIVNVEHTLY